MALAIEDPPLFLKYTLMGITGSDPRKISSRRNISLFLSRQTILHPIPKRY